MDSHTFINNVIKDIKIELDDEFDRNFERKAFFDRKWVPLSPNYHPTTGAMLVRTGALRRGLRSQISGTSLIYTNSVIYAGVHNYGAVIRQDFVMTPKMRRRALAKYKQSRNKQDLKTAYAKHIRRTIRIPARPFVGRHPVVDESVDRIAKENVQNMYGKKIKQILNLNRK